MVEEKKKWILLTLVIILTAALIFVFRMKDLGRFVREQKSNLTNFYTANLRPLLAQISINNDDIFNFAFHKRLPLNYEKNKFLVLGNEQNGSGYFTFTENLPDESESYDEFINKMDLNKHEKAKVDSILDSYRDKIEEQVLVNDKNTMAINSGLWNLNRAIFADVLAYTSKVSKTRLKQMIPSGNRLLDDPSMKNMIAEAKTARDPNYILVTPDSVFDMKYNYNMKQYHQNMARVEQNMKKFDEKFKGVDFKIKFDRNFIEKNDKAGTDYRIHIDTNRVKINVPKEVTIPVPIPNFDEILHEINSSLGNSNVQEPRNERNRFPKAKKPNSLHFEVGNPESGDKPFEFNINIPDVDSILQANLKILDTLNVNFHLNLDSPDKKTAFKRDINYRKMNLLNEQLTKLSGKLREHPEQAKELQKEIDKLNKELNKLYSNNKE